MTANIDVTTSRWDDFIAVYVAYANASFKSGDLEKATVPSIVDRYIYYMSIIPLPVKRLLLRLLHPESP